MKYQIDDNQIIVFNWYLPQKIQVDTDIVLPLLSLINKGLIYRGRYITTQIDYSIISPDFFIQGNYYRMIMDYRISDPNSYVYTINNIVYTYDRVEASMGGIYFYYKHNEDEIFVSQGQMGGTADINVPTSLGEPTSLSVGIIDELENPMMINAKAPYGSLETEAVWTVSTSTLSPIGEVISTTIAENQIWSNYNN